MLLMSKRSLVNLDSLFDTEAYRNSLRIRRFNGEKLQFVDDFVNNKKKINEAINNNMGESGIVEEKRLEMEPVIDESC